METSDYRLIGTLVKLHGFKGRYLLVSDISINEEIENWESVFLEIDGLLIPFFIDYIKLSSDTSVIIGFEDIDSPEKAKEFISSPVYQTATLAGEENINPVQLQGYRVIDTHAGFIGEIDQILDYSQNLLFRILNDEREILIPVSEEFIIKVNHKKKEILISAPDGLLELYQ